MALPAHPPWLAAAQARPFPPVDDHLLRDGSPFELLNGRLIPVPPADEPHSLAHSDLVTLLHAHVAPGFRVGVDLMTRVAIDSEVAPDASVYPEGRDDDGHRQLEALAFEVLASERRPHAAHKARLLVARGVRRVFAIDLGWSQVLEWDMTLAGGQGDWRLLPPGSVIEDTCLVRSLSTNALRGAVQVSHEVMEGWVAKKHPVLERELELREAKGEARGLREALADLCEVLGVELTNERREHLARFELEALRALWAHLKAHKTWPDNPASG